MHLYTQQLFIDCFRLSVSVHAPNIDFLKEKSIFWAQHNTQIMAFFQQSCVCLCVHTLIMISMDITKTEKAYFLNDIVIITYI